MSVKEEEREMCHVVIANDLSGDAELRRAVKEHGDGLTLAKLEELRIPYHQVPLDCEDGGRKALRAGEEFLRLRIVGTALKVLDSTKVFGAAVIEDATSSQPAGTPGISPSVA